ncbi:uncharacterized protein LOC131671957 [Phymastichus coffea]|uniref:uncharacterized protein LOC131671957 n=1 Tax=Phymastichus coffea TaxID=108790 RepID=UPI00273AB469|nr:uncharacterized protein LOC131671957 [Phymastichus coffea]
MALNNGAAIAGSLSSSSFTQYPNSYASATVQPPLPRKDHAIITDSVEGATIDDYIDGLETLTDASNIKFISKISGNRVCVYLINSSLVETLSDKTFTVKDTNLKIRPLVGKNKRVVISNVCPIIPHDLLLNCLKERGITPVSGISHIRAGLSKPGRSHILSFRRQIYIKEEEVNLLPESVQLTYDNTTYWIYFSTDSMCCFVCKESGHTAKLCPSLPTTATTPTTSSTTLPTVQTKPTKNDNANTLAPNVTTFNKPSAQKSPPPSTSSSSESSFPQPATPTTVFTDNATIAANTTKIFKSPSPKKLKKTSPKPVTDSLSVEDHLQPVLEAIKENRISISVHINVFQSVLEKNYGQSNALSIALSVTDNIEGIINTIDEVYKLINSSSFKGRLTRLKKKLSKMNITGSESDLDTESDSSQRNTQILKFLKMASSKNNSNSQINATVNTSTDAKTLRLMF